MFLKISDFSYLFLLVSRIFRAPCTALVADDASVALAVAGAEWPSRNDRG